MWLERVGWMVRQASGWSLSFWSALLLVGFVVGHLSAWMAAAPRRRETRLRRRRISALEGELHATQTRLMPPPSVPNLRQ